jgi:hypothetical protein
VALPGGCKPSAPPHAPATVRGAVSFQSQFLVGGMVTFSPDAERGGSGKPIRGDIGPDGRYQLAVAGNSTVPPGWYRVAILPPPSLLLAQPVFPTQLARPDLSGLVREVHAGRENVFDFAIEVPPG